MHRPIGSVKWDDVAWSLTNSVMVKVVTDCADCKGSKMLKSAHVVLALRNIHGEMLSVLIHGHWCNYNGVEPAIIKHEFMVTFSTLTKNLELL